MRYTLGEYLHLCTFLAASRPAQSVIDLALASAPSRISNFRVLGRPMGTSAHSAHMIVEFGILAPAVAEALPPRRREIF